MKSAKVSFHHNFPETPVSAWAGARWKAWFREIDATGHLKSLTQVRHPFPAQRKLWCLLEVHFDQIDLVFATPQELDQFICVLSENPLPSGPSLVRKCSIGRPHRHWLAKLPAKAKALKFRRRLCAYLSECDAATQFRDFYEKDPVRIDFPGYFDTLQEAREGRRTP